MALTSDAWRGRRACTFGTTSAPPSYKQEQVRKYREDLTKGMEMFGLFIETEDFYNTDHLPNLEKSLPS